MKKQADLLTKVKNILTNRGASQRPFCSAVVPAAGASRRMETDCKLFLPLGDRPVLVHTLQALQDCGAVDEIVVAARPQDIPVISGFVRDYALSKVKTIVAGGATRGDSVRKALDCCNAQAAYILIHDGARPFAMPDMITRCIVSCGQYGACLAAVKVKDTIKEVSQTGYIVRTPTRETLWAAQTPQVFDAALIRAAYQKAWEDGEEYTDDCGPVEALGKHVYVCSGDYENIKITTPEDYITAQAIWESRNG